MTTLRHIWMIALIAVAACAPQESKYPFPPQFVTPEMAPARFLDVPPQPRSSEWNNEVNAVIEKQKHLTPAELSAMREEMPVTPEMIVYPVLGEQVTREAYPALYNLLLRTGSDAWRIGDNAKKYWSTTRPWLADKRVKLQIDPIHSHAYPSGHTTTGHVWAAVISDVVPEAHQQAFDRANDIAQHRVLAGVHYPHDIKGGKKLAKLIAHKIRVTPCYEKALEAAQQELAQRGYHFNHAH